MNTLSIIAIIFSALSAGVSAYCAYRTYRDSKKVSIRDKIDLLKADIRVKTFDSAGQQKLRNKIFQSGDSEYNKIICYEDLSKVLYPEHQNKEWVKLLPGAVDELIGEGHLNLKRTVGAQATWTFKENKGVTDNG